MCVYIYIYICIYIYTRHLHLARALLQQISALHHHILHRLPRKGLDLRDTWQTQWLQLPKKTYHGTSRCPLGIQNNKELMYHYRVVRCLKHLGHTPSNLWSFSWGQLRLPATRHGVLIMMYIPKHEGAPIDSNLTCRQVPCFTFGRTDEKYEIP